MKRNQAIARESNYSIFTQSRIDLLIVLSAILLILLSVLLGIHQTRPPAAAALDAPLNEFSASRAINHLEKIAQKPHPLGSSEHHGVRDYILSELRALGVDPEVQATTALRKMRDSSIVCAGVENIVVRVPGNNNSRSVLLVGHYDSAPTGPGASDDGAAVAAMLETLRAIKNSAPIKNDLVWLFSDAEEIGLLGAKAFADENRLAGGVGLAINFEARGNSGAVIMFETSNNNGRLIREFAKAAPYPVATSLSYEIYKRMPNDTDLSVFKEAGLAGLNFAYIEGLNHYHTQLDNISNINPDSVQHHGSYMLALVKHFGTLDLNQSSESDHIYFDILGAALIHYPASMAMILNIIVLLLFTSVVATGIKKDRLKYSGVIAAFFAWLLNLMMSILAAFLVWRLLSKLRNVGELIYQEDAHIHKVYLASFICFTITVNLVIYILLRKKVKSLDLFVGMLAWWGVFMFASGWLLPGASYLFTLPLFFSLVALRVFMGSKHKNMTDPRPLLLFSISAVPGIILSAPIIRLIFAAMSFNVLPVIVLIITLQLALLIPHLELLTNYGKYMSTIGGLVIAVILFIAGAYLSAGDNSRKRQDSLFYVMNSDTGEAVWSSFDSQPDEWQSQFFNGAIEKGSLNEYAALGYNGYLKSRAQLIEALPPSVTKLEDLTRNDARHLHLRVASPRRAQALMLATDSDSRILASIINGKRVVNDAKDGWNMRYYAVPEGGIDLILELQPSSPLKLRVSDLSYGLPDSLVVKPRPGHIMPSPMPYSDTTIVSKSFNF
jgi:hypothetical protein